MPVTELPVAEGGAGPYGITTGPDGALWFTQVHAGRIGRATTGGAVRAHQLDPATSGPSLLTTGPDGALWLLTANGEDDRLLRIARP